MILVMMNAVNLTSRAEEVMPYATNIMSMNASLSFGDGYIIEVHIQYKTSGGAWYNVDNGRTSRCYTPGDTFAVETYYYSPVVGTQYRCHVYMRVVDSDGYLHDASVTNSNVYTYTG